MSTTVELEIIKRAGNHLGLLSRNEQDFIERIEKLPRNVRLSQKQRAWLYDIGEKKLNMGPFEREAPAMPVDYKQRACA